jgi:putative membrane protein
MMAFGFVIARFGLFLHELAPLHPNVTAPASGLSVWLGTALVVLGVVVCLLSAREHLVFVRRLERGEPYRPTRWSMGVTVSVVLAAGGVIIAVYLVTLRP